MLLVTQPKYESASQRGLGMLADLGALGMELVAHLAGAFAVAALLIHVATSLSTAWRCRRSAEPRPLREPQQRPAVTIIRPVCGLDAYEEATLRSTFELDYPQLEILLCCASAQDPVVPLVQRLIAEHPHVEARLLIGDDRVSENPKLNNVIKGWRAASHAWIVITDSNVLLPRHYIDRLFAAWTPGTGLVSAPPIGARPANPWAELECAFLNGYHARSSELKQRNSHKIKYLHPMSLLRATGWVPFGYCLRNARVGLQQLLGPGALSRSVTCRAAAS